MKNAFATTSLFAVILLAAAGPVSAGDTVTAAAPLGWTEVGPPSAAFGPTPQVRLGAIVSRELVDPVETVRTGHSYDREMFSPHLTGSPEAPALPIGIPLVAQGAE